jgi:hypothetical protein
MQRTALHAAADAGCAGKVTVLRDASTLLARERDRRHMPGRRGKVGLMASGKNGKVSTSSVVMKAIDAKTFTELETFVKDLESRPTERLLRDLPELAALSESKVSIISYVIATKFRHADAAGRNTIRENVAATFERLPPGQERDRVLDILERLRGFENAPLPMDSE